MSKEKEETPSSSSNDVPDAEKTKNENVVSCINVLIQSSVKGQKAGAYTLEEASTIMEAVKFLQNNFGKGPAAPTV
jgi:hypothetical protein